MSTETVPSNVVYLETVSNAECLDKLLADEDFIVDLIDQINQNFLIEVEASHTRDERACLASTNPIARNLRSVSGEGIARGDPDHTR
jgi:hypothetical protein